MKNFNWVAPLVGLPWEAYATGPAAYDCHGLVCHVQHRHYRRRLDRHLEVVSGDVEAMHTAICAEQETGRWQRLSAPKDGCVVLLTTGTRFHHVGVWLAVNGGRVLHSRAKRGVALDSVQHLRTLGFREFEYWLPV